LEFSKEKLLPTGSIVVLKEGTKVGDIRQEADSPE
jgi:hypothetical protein